LWIWLVLVEEDRLQLFRAVNVERLARDLGDRVGQHSEPVLEFLADLLEQRQIQAHACPLHRHQNRDQRQLDLPVGAHQRQGVERTLERRGEAHRVRGAQAAKLRQLVSAKGLEQLGLLEHRAVGGVGQRFSQVVRRQVAERVKSARRVDHVRGEARVEAHAAERYVVLGQRTDGGLQAVAQFGLVGTQPGSDALEQLLESPPVGEARKEGPGHALHAGGDEVSMVGIDGEGHAQNLGDGGVSGFGDHLDRDAVGRLQLRQKASELSRDGFDGDRHMLRARGRLAGQSLGDVLELQLAQQGQQALEVGLAKLERLEIDVFQLEVGADRHQVAGKLGLFPVLGQPLLQLLSPERGQVFVDAFQGLMLCDQLDGGLLADARHPGHVVRGVTHEGEDVSNAFGANAPLGQRLFGPQHFELGPALAQVVQPDVVGHQLQEVFVAADDEALEALGGQVQCDRADHVVRLDAGQLYGLNVVGVYELADVGHRLAEIVGHRLSVSLVLRVGLVPLGGALGVPDHGEVVGLGVVDQLGQRLREAEGGRGVEPARVRQRSADEREVAAIGQVGPVDQKQRLSDEVGRQSRGGDGGKALQRARFGHRTPIEKLAQRCGGIEPKTPLRE
jgi:hypothetical protein